jgi:hypothetical protein
MPAGAAYCEHVHAVLLSRFRKVAEELDKNTHAAEVAEVQHRLEHIVKVNEELRERVNKASEVCCVPVHVHAHRCPRASSSDYCSTVSVWSSFLLLFS